MKKTYIKHNRAMDLCFKVLDQVPCSGGILVCGTWVNMGFNKSFLSAAPYEPDYFIINWSKLKYWELSNNKEKIDCLRDCNWFELDWGRKNHDEKS